MRLQKRKRRFVERVKRVPFHVRLEGHEPRQWLGQVGKERLQGNVSRLKVFGKQHDRRREFDHKKPRVPQREAAETNGRRGSLWRPMHLGHLSATANWIGLKSPSGKWFSLIVGVSIVS